MNCWCSKFVFICAVWSACLTVDVLAGSDKQVKDWHVYCSEVLVCQMSTTPNNDEFYGIGLVRGTIAAAPVDLSISQKGRIVAGSRIQISVPGQLEDFRISVGSNGNDDAQEKYSDPAILDVLIPAMRKGDVMEISVQTEKGMSTDTVSLSGFSAALLFVDEA